jgi:DNA-binding NtrC family response regulator
MMVLNDMIDLADLPEFVRNPEHVQSRCQQSASSNAIPTAAEGDSPASMLENTEKRLIADALANASGNQSEAARLLRIGRDALRYKMKKYGLTTFISN